MAAGGAGHWSWNSTRKPGRNASTAQSSGTDQQDNNNGPNSYSYFAVTGNSGGSYGQVTGQGDYDSGGGAGWNGNGMNSAIPRHRRAVAGNGFLGGNYDNSRNPYVAVGGFGGGRGASDGGGGRWLHRWNGEALEQFGHGGGGGATCFVVATTTLPGFGESVWPRAGGCYSDMPLMGVP